MSSRPEDERPEAGKLPTGRLARTARVGGLVTSQGLRWAGMRTATLSCKGFWSDTLTVPYDALDDTSDVAHNVYLYPTAAAATK